MRHTPKAGNPVTITSKYPPAEPEALNCEPLKAAFTEPSAPYAPDMASPVNNAYIYPVGALHQHDLTHAHI
jgi:hypothetical protein